MDEKRKLAEPLPPPPEGGEERQEWEGLMFRLLVENVKDYAIFILDGEGRVMTWSKGGERLLGYTEAEIVGQKCDLFFTPDDRERGEPQREMRTAVETGRGEDDRWHVRKDGSYFWCSGVMTCLKDQEGRVRGFAKIMRDLTEKKQAEERLIESEARFRRLLDSNIIGIGVTEKEGRIKEANDEYLRIIGHTREELGSGQVWWTKLTPPEHLDRDRKGLEEANRRGACTPYEKDYINHRDGRRVPVLIAFTPLNEPPDQYLIYVIDLTEQKKMEKRLRQANKNKDEFLAMLGHELRNPLAPMLTALHILSQNKCDDEALQRQSLQMIERQVRHMARLVDDLLEVARITKGKVELKREHIELSAVVLRAVETARPMIESQAHRFSVALSDEPMWVKADPVRIEQVLTNLLNNAAKYTERGGQIWLTVSREGNEAVMQVRDTGVGIDAEMQPRIFEIFSQSERTLDRSRGGLGVGLTLVKTMVELHGGSVQVFSAGVGKGSEFTVRLPLLEAEPASAGDAKEPQEQPQKFSLRVLVVDDNNDAADSLRMLLQMSGHEVIVAHTGPTAIEQAVAWRPDVILLDIGLPGLDGYQVALRLRERPDMRGVLLIAMTGYGQDTDRQRARQAGFNHHFVKPIDPQQLLRFFQACAAQRGRLTGGAS